MYNPRVRDDRVRLASAIERKLLSCKFRMEDSNGEKVYSLPVKDTGMYIVVYTSIVGNEVRRDGKDAIRVAGIYIDEGVRRGITSNKRVNRTGDVDSIVDRMYVRMRKTWVSCLNASRCRCGAPQFRSKSGNLVCAKICWK